MRTSRITFLLERTFRQYKHGFKLPSQCYRSISSFDQNIVRSPHADIEIPPLKLHEYIWKDLNKWPDKIATESSISGKKFTYKQARERSRSIAAALQKDFKLQPGDCIAVVSQNMPDYPLVMLAASEAGLVVSTVSSSFVSDEIAKQLVDSNAKLIVSSPNKLAAAVEAAGKIQRKMPVLIITEAEGEAAPAGGILLDDVLTNSEVIPIDRSIHDDLILPYSSGTTGLPKGVQLSHHNLVSNLEQMDSPGVRLLLQTTETQQESVLGLLPFYHIYGMVVVAFTTLAGGGKLVTFPNFEPTQFISSSVQHKIGLMYLVPPLMLFLGGHPAVKKEHLSYIRMILTGAAPIGLDDLLRLHKKGPHIQILQGYGLTETSPVVLNTVKSRISKYACGAPVPNTQIKVLDVESGVALEAGKVGELCVKGPQVMKGYLGKPDETAKMIVDGWLKTGDLAYYDEDGDFFVVDRLKELIKVKGLQVAPAELEAVLRSHPAVANAAVIGVPHEKWGEAPKAFVVLKQGQVCPEKELIDFVAKQLSEHKHLSGGLVFVDSIPQSPSGKILRRELKKNL